MVFALPKCNFTLIGRRHRGAGPRGPVPRLPYPQQGRHEHGEKLKTMGAVLSPMVTDVKPRVLYYRPW